MRNILIIALLIGTPTLLSAKEIKVEYKDLSYTIKQDSKKFIYKDSSLTKEYDIKDCNKQQFEIFWAQFEIDKKDISSLNKVNGKEVLKLTEDNKKVQKINPYAKLGTFLTGMQNKIVAFEINEKMKCTK